MKKLTLTILALFAYTENALYAGQKDMSEAQYAAQAKKEGYMFHAAGGMYCKQKLDIKFPLLARECDQLEKDFFFLKGNKDWMTFRATIDGLAYKKTKKMYHRNVTDAVKIPMMLMVMGQAHKELVEGITDQRQKELEKRDEKPKTKQERWVKLFLRVNDLVSLDCKNFDTRTINLSPAPAQKK